MHTLPSPRYKFYESNNFDIIKKNVLKETNKVVTALGYYPNDLQFDLLDEIKLFS